MAAAFALLAVPASAQSDDSQSHLSSDPRVAQARALLGSDQFEEALGILRPLVPGLPDSIDVRFLVGLAAMGASSQVEGEEEKNAFLDEAIAALRSILIENPGLVRVRLELARAFFLKGEDKLSREHFDRVLAGNPDPQVAANIRRFLGGIEARRRWSGYFGLAVAPDSNINSASDTKVIYLNGLPFRFGEDSGSRSGWGVSVWGGGEYQAPLDEGSWFRAGADINNQEYPGTEHDQIGLSAHAGPRWRLGPSWRLGRQTDVSLLANTRRSLVGGKLSNREIGARFELEGRVDRRHVVTGRASWHRRTFVESGSRDGYHATLSLGVTRLVSSTFRTGMTIGFGRERPKSFRFQNSSRWLRANMDIALPWGFTVGVRGEFRHVDYKGPWFEVRDPPYLRRDRSRSLRLSVLNRGVTVYGFSPQFALIRDKRESTAQLYDYQRNRAMLSFVRQF